MNFRILFKNNALLYHLFREQLDMAQSQFAHILIVHEWIHNITSRPIYKACLYFCLAKQITSHQSNLKHEQLRYGMLERHRRQVAQRRERRQSYNSHLCCESPLGLNKYEKLSPVNLNSPLPSLLFRGGSSTASTDRVTFEIL